MKYIEFSVQSLDRYSAQNNPKDVCKRMQELGMPGFGLTQTGMLTAVEPMRTQAAAAGLKLIPGIKAFYKNDNGLQDLRLIALDYDGYIAISMAVTDSNNEDGYAVMTDDILNRYFAPGALGHGHVTATTAGLDGPLARIILRNRLVDQKVSELKRRFKGASGNIDTRVEKTAEMLRKIGAELEAKKAERDDAKKLSESKFDARQKRVDRLKEKNSPEYEDARISLENDRKAAAEAKGIFENAKKEVTKLLKRQSILSKEMKELETLQGAHYEFKRLLAEEESRRLSEDDILSAVKEEAGRLSVLFGDRNFFIELQYHGADGEAEVFSKLSALANILRIPTLATNDVHIIAPTEEERLRRQILRSLKDGDKWIPEAPGDDQRYIKSGEEMFAALTKIIDKEIAEEALENTVRLFERANVVFPEGEKHYPKFPTEGGMSADEALEAEIQKGIAWRFPNGMDKAHYDRLEHEIRIIEGMGYSDYHLIVKDFLEYGRALAGYPAEALDNAPLTIEEAKKEAEEKGYRVGIATGPGRGSAVGSLVCYLLGITSLDPLKYDLLFERFLNPERVSMPDIDSDLSNTVRSKVIQYVQHKYGEDSVCGILTMDAIAPKGAIRTAAKYYGLKKSEDAAAYQKLGDQMARLVPSEPGTSFASETEGKPLYDFLKEKYTGNPDALAILRWAKILEGSFTTYGVHAGGVVISDNHPIKEYMPLRWNSQLSEWTTQCDMYRVEERGLIKMDFLGLKTLDVITEALRLIEKTTGKVIDPLDIPIDDKEVFQNIFAKANTGAAFQFESSGMRAMLKRFKPETFEDLIILVSMFRPGPLQFIDDVIAVKNGTAKRKYLTKELEPILGKTYCGIVYQEQVMEIFQKLAGYTLGGADMVRRAMSKKKHDKIAAEREAFIHGDPSRNIDGCVARNIREEAASALFDQMTEFAKYAFNKSHAAAYALVAYWTGWLKYHYPAEFICAAMNWADTDDKLRGLIREAEIFHVQVMAPDVNLSQSRFSVSNGRIIYGLSNIKSVGDNGTAIVRKRECGGMYQSIKDLFLRVPVRKDATENLIKAGALDGFCPNRQAMLAAVESMKKETKKYLEKQAFVSDAEKLLQNSEGKNFLETQKKLGISVVEKEITAAQLSARIENAKQAAEAAWNTLNSLTLAADTKEDLEEKLNAEHEMLRAFITGHPLDAYETDAEGISRADRVDENSFMLVGLVTDLKLKNRKSDGKPMAFFMLEDKTGTIEVCVFTAAYTSCMKYLKEGKAVAVTGRAQMTENGTDENGVVQKSWQFIAETVTPPTPARRIFLPVSSYYRFHVEEEKEFRKKYEKTGGYRLVFFDETMKETREATYRVSEEVLNLTSAKKI